jgi:hypothetical protein
VTFFGKIVCIWLVSRCSWAKKRLFVVRENSQDVGKLQGFFSVWQTMDVELRRLAKCESLKFQKFFFAAN